MNTATMLLDRPNMRRRRAESIARAMLDAVTPFLMETGSERRDAYYAMLTILCDEGVEVITDHTRSEANLPPRGPDGWTFEELAALEARRLAVLTQPLTVPLYSLQGDAQG